MRGLISRIVSQGNPRRSKTPGPKFSTMTSDSSMSLRRIAFPWSVLRLSVILRLLQFSIVKYRLSTSGRSRSCLRVMSPVGASSFTTSAPSQARIWVADGPDWTCVMSRMRMPSNALIYRPRSLVHRLVHGSRRVHLGIDPHVDERGQTRFPGALQCGRDVGRVAH